MGGISGDAAFMAAFVLFWRRINFVCFCFYRRIVMMLQVCWQTSRLGFAMFDFIVRQNSAVFRGTYKCALSMQRHPLLLWLKEINWLTRRNKLGQTSREMTSLWWRHEVKLEVTWETKNSLEICENWRLFVGAFLSRLFFKKCWAFCCLINVFPSQSSQFWAGLTSLRGIRNPAPIWSTSVYYGQVLTLNQNRSNYKLFVLRSERLVLNTILTLLDNKDWNILLL